MANWVVLSIIVIFGIIFMAFIAPNIFPSKPEGEKSMSLQQFCGQYKLQSRQHIFLGVMQCFQTTKAGATVTDTACDVQETAGQFSFKGECPLAPAPPLTKVPNNQIP